MNTPRRAASRAAPATVFGMSWNLRSRNTSAPRFWIASTTAGPPAVKSWEPILKRRTRPSSRSARRSAWARESTSSATMRRSRGSGGAMELLQRLDGDLALEQGLDAADGRLGAVHGRVVGDVLGHRGAADDVGVLPRAAVLGRIEDEGDLFRASSGRRCSAGSPRPPCRWSRRSCPGARGAWRCPPSPPGRSPCRRGAWRPGARRACPGS